MNFEIVHVQLTLFLSERPKTPANNDNGLAQYSR
jgi:hypothetical protein